MKTLAALISTVGLIVCPPALQAQTSLDEDDGRALLAARTDTQDESNVLSRRARLVVEDVFLSDALDRLQESSGVAVAYSPSLLPPERRVSCDCATKTVGEAVANFLSGTDFEFLVMADQIVIRRKTLPSVRAAPEPFVLEPISAVREDLADQALAPPRPVQAVGSITGQVVAQQTGTPLAAVQVYVSDLDLGVLSQANGRYLLLNVPPGTYTVTAERIGYRRESASVTVGDGATVVQDFSMAEEALALDAMIVTGTPGGTQRKALGNVVSQIDASSIENRAAVRFEETLGSTVPGVRLMAPAGSAGGASEIRIRGSSSLALSGDPLIYVDGIRINTRRVFDTRGSATSRLQDIDPSSIESIEIIKGPAAATLYGTEASNGVIQIITKKGVQGETTFEGSVELGVNWQPHPSQNFGLHWYKDPVTGEILNQNIYEMMKQPDQLGQDMFQNGPIQRYHVSARGGTDLVRYYAAVSREDVQGFSRIDFTESWNTQASITVVPTEDLSFTVNAQRMTGSTRDIGTLMCSFDCWANPIQDRKTVGGLADEFRSQMDAESDIRHRTRTTWSAQISHNPTDWFSHRITGGVDNSGMKREDFTKKVGDAAYGGRAGTCGRLGCRDVWDISTPTRTLDYSATATLPVTDRLTSATSVGLQYFQEQQSELYLSGQDYSVSTLSTIGGANARDASEDFVENITVGTFVQDELNWEDRIFLTGAVRFDDNSAFGTDFDAAIYPKLSGSWVLSEEAFWNQPLGITEFRLRGAWGKSGQQPNAFAATRLWEPITGPGEPALTPLAVGNPNLGPEVGSEIELGFDATLLSERVSLDFTWFNRKTKDAIVARPIRPSVGFPGTQFVNIGQTSAWGTETALSAQLLTANPIRWDVNLAFSTFGNRIDDLGGLDDLTVVALSGMASRAQYHVEGFPIAGIFERKVVSADFVSGNSGAVTNIMCDGGTGKGGREMGGAPVPCADAPRVFWGQVDPSWQVGLNSAWTVFGDWRLSATIDAQGGHVLNADYIAGQNTRHSEKHVKENDPIFQGNQAFSRGANVIHKAGFAKLREVSLRYTLPDLLVSRIGASSASLRASLYNIATLWIQQEYTPSGQRIWDPEMLSPNFEYNGIATGAPPPLSHATVQFDVVF